MKKPAKQQWVRFEDEVFDAVKRAARRGVFPFSGTFNIRRHAEYVAVGTGDKVKLEVSLEVFRPGAVEPFLIWLFECKHKSNKRGVEVGDVRQLHSKILELGVARMTGSIVTNVGFQRGAISLAESLGISLCLLKKDLVYVSKFARNQPPEERVIILVKSGIDLHGTKISHLEFDSFITQGIHETLNPGPKKVSGTVLGSGRPLRACE